MRLCITWVELKLHKQCIQSAFRVARETENVVFFTELSLNAFCRNNNNASQSWPTVQLAVPLCACTGLLVQHYNNCDVQDCWYSITVTVHVQECWYSITVTVHVQECWYSITVTVHVLDCWYNIH